MAKKKPLARPVTMRDVAALAGVSLSTVSRVLSQKPSGIPITQETQRKVYEAVEQLNYFPNLTASSLRTQRTNMIAVMIADLSNPFYYYITRTIQDIALERDYDVLISNTDHLQEYEQRFCEAIMRRPVDGIILVPYHLTNDAIDQLLQRTGAAITVLGRHIDHPDVDIISADDEKATYDAVCWLIQEKGHQRVAFIGASPSFSVSVRRQRGYERAMHEAGLPVHPDWIREGDFTHESGERTMRTLLAMPDRPSAVFACNDNMAIGALNEALDQRLNVPGDVAVVGFDNIPAAALIRPKLTTVAHHPIELGRLLAEALFERINGEVGGVQRHFDVPCELIIRQSA
jgi:LacI family transcriptional regulator